MLVLSWLIFKFFREDKKSRGVPQVFQGASCAARLTASANSRLLDRLWKSISNRLSQHGKDRMQRFSDFFQSAAWRHPADHSSIRCPVMFRISRTTQFLPPGEDFRRALGHEDGVLKMRAGSAVRR